MPKTSPCKECGQPRPCKDPKNCERRIKYAEEFDRYIGSEAVDVHGSYRLLPK